VIPPLSLDTPAVAPEATIELLENDAARIVTGMAPWQDAVGFTWLA
jgi:hypothetical protein